MYEDDDTHGMDWVTRKLFRDSSMRPFQPLHQDDIPEDRWRRSDKRMKCLFCGCQYWEHPLFEGYSERCIDRDILDHRLCNGDIVHL